MKQLWDTISTFVLDHHSLCVWTVIGLILFNMGLILWDNRAAIFERILFALERHGYIVFTDAEETEER